MSVSRNRRLGLASLLLSLAWLERVRGGCTSKTGLCSGLLGAGTGLGSCAAPPFRSSRVQFPLGCPRHKPCCSEFGYCREREDWDFGHFRDCNGVSNGARLDPQTLTREARAGTFVGSPAGLIGPRLELREQFEEARVTDKKRPTTPAPSREELAEIRRENRKFTLRNVDELKTLIYLMNKNYGVGSANNIGVTLRLKKKLPSNNFKTKKDFLEQLRIAIMTERRRRMDRFYK